jgi:UDP:flavonoid glycosyltransferase YjiC (YdhE family)
LGSAGDCLPLLPLAASLRTAGHKIVWHSNFELANLLRSVGERVAITSSTKALGFQSDPRVVTTRFWGWASWRNALEYYVAPTFGADVNAICRWLARLEVDTVVVAGINPAMRTACHILDINTIDLTFSTQHASRVDPTTLAPRTLAAIGLSLNNQDPVLASRLIWGSRPDAVLIDPILAPPSMDTSLSLIGYPYFDRGSDHPESVHAVANLIASTSREVFMCTMGTAVGPRANAYLDALQTIAMDMHVVIVVVGLDPAPKGPLVRLADGLYACRRIALSDLSGLRIRGFIHHAGLGTSIGVCRLGLPAITVPQAFDQPLISMRLSELGVAVNARNDADLANAVSQIVESPGMTDAAKFLREQLTPLEETVARFTSLFETTTASRI